MPEPEWTTLRAVRVVAEARSLDQLHVEPGITALRLATDDVLLVGADDPTTVSVSDPHAIVEIDRGWSGRWLDQAELSSVVEPHIEWTLPAERPVLAQGLVAAVPAKVLIERDRALIVTPTAYLAELIERIGGERS